MQPARYHSSSGRGGCGSCCGHTRRSLSFTVIITVITAIITTVTGSLTNTMK